MQYTLIIKDHEGDEIKKISAPTYEMLEEKVGALMRYGSFLCPVCGGSGEQVSEVYGDGEHFEVDVVGHQILPCDACDGKGKLTLTEYEKLDAKLEEKDELEHLRQKIESGDDDAIKKLVNKVGRAEAEYIMKSWGFPGDYKFVK